MELRQRVRSLEDDLSSLLLDSVVDYAMFVLDPEGNVASWNPGAERIKGWREEEVLGKHFSLFYTPEDIADGMPARHLDEASANGRLEDERWRVRKDGGLFWADVVITALRDSDGRLVGFAKITRDLTQRKKAVEAQRALAVFKERDRIAHELHQGVIRTLFGIGLTLQMLAGQADDARVEARLNQAVDSLDDAISQLRSHVFAAGS